MIKARTGVRDQVLASDQGSGWGKGSGVKSVIKARTGVVSEES